MLQAIYSVDPKRSRGRFYPEMREDFRSPFQRDRDRIVHSTAFRRLAQKTQVFVAYEGDLFRTRLTHSLEVAQVARALARRLKLNEDLAEAVAISHDLGHPPFGHTGEDSLSLMMKDYGGFDHNAQALRIVTLREERYANFPGLNLTWETIEGIAKHNGPIIGSIPWEMEALADMWDLELQTHASLEAQVAAIADDIAYNHHDLQDGLRSGLISEAQIRTVPLIAQAFEKIEKLHPNASSKIKRYEAFSLFFGQMVEDVYAQSVFNLGFNPQNVDDIRHHDRQIVEFSPAFFAELNELKAFLFDNLYRHPKVLEMRELAKAILEKSFEYAFENPEILPRDWREDVDITNDTIRARLVCDYISGMTDSYISFDWQSIHGMSWKKAF